MQVELTIYVAEATGKQKDPHNPDAGYSELGRLTKITSLSENENDNLKPVHLHTLHAHVTDHRFAVSLINSETMDKTSLQVS